MKYPCKWTFAPTEVNTMCEKFLQELLGMDIHEQASVSVVGASNKKRVL